MQARGSTKTILLEEMSANASVNAVLIKHCKRALDSLKTPTLLPEPETSGMWGGGGGGP